MEGTERLDGRRILIVGGGQQTYDLNDLPIGNGRARVMPLPSYSASKAALEALTRHAAIEAAPAKRVNLIVPGLIDTSLGRPPPSSIRSARRSESRSAARAPPGRSPPPRRSCCPARRPTSRARAS